MSLQKQQLVNSKIRSSKLNLPDICVHIISHQKDTLGKSY